MKEFSMKKEFIGRDDYSEEVFRATSFESFKKLISGLGADYKLYEEIKTAPVALPLAKAQLCKHLPQALKQQVDVVYFNADKIYTVVLTDKSEIQFKFLKEARLLIEKHNNKQGVQK